jgi:hypothetical protein
VHPHRRFQGHKTATNSHPDNPSGARIQPAPSLPANRAAADAPSRPPPHRKLARIGATIPSKYAANQPAWRRPIVASTLETYAIKVLADTVRPPQATLGQADGGKNVTEAS